MRRYRMARVRLRSSSRRKARPARRRRRGSLLLFLLLALQVVYLASLAALTYTNVVGPERWRWAALNLYLPQWLWALPGGALLLAFLLHGRRYVWLPALSLLWVAGPIMGLSLHPPHDGAVSGTALRVMTYNIEGHVESVMVADEIDRAKPDIVMLQEAGAGARELLPGWHIAGPYGDVLIASRLPLEAVERRRLPLTDGSACYVSCRVRLQGQPVTLYSIHLPSPVTGIKPLIRQGESGVADWQQSINSRYSHAVLLAGQLRDDTGPRILGGDLNAPSTSTICRALTGTGLSDAFSEAGWGYGYTYGHALPVRHSFVRIDHILASSQWQVERCWVGGAEGSDHRPVIADLALTAR